MPEIIWFTPQQIAEHNTEKAIEAIVQRNLEPYQRMKTVDKISSPPKWKRRDGRGSKPGVKRGPYKKDHERTAS